MISRGAMSSLIIVICTVLVLVLLTQFIVDSPGGCVHTTSARTSSNLVRTLRIYQYPYKQLVPTSDSFADIDECASTQYTASADSRYAMEYALLNKLDKWSQSEHPVMRIPLSHSLDYEENVTVDKLFDVEFTKDPSKADFFVVPHITACVFHQLNHSLSWDEKVSIVEKYFMSLMDRVVQDYPYWNQSALDLTPGANHVFIFTWDFGVCLCPLVRDLLKKSIKLQGHGVRSTTNDGCFNFETDIVIPQASWKPPSAVFVEPAQQAYIRRHPSTKVPVMTTMNRRPYSLFMRGAVDSPHPYLVYSHGVRQFLSQLSNNMSAINPNQKSLVVKTGYAPDVYDIELQQSRIGICARGWAPWTSRLQDVMNRESIPLIIADEISLPYEGLLDWRKFSMKVNESNIADLVHRVDSLNVDYLNEKQRQLWLHNQYLSWHGDDRYNAFAMLMRELAGKLWSDSEPRFSTVAFSEFY